VVIVAPATAASILQGTTSGAARKALDTIMATVVGIVFGILMVHLLGVSILSVLLTVTATIIICPLVILLLVPQRVPLIETRDAISAWAFRQYDLAIATADWLESGATSAFHADVASVHAARRTATRPPGV